MIGRSAGPRRSWLVPEVVQVSAMDCGPAALSSLLGGMGIPVETGRLREACQTDVDGTSIDALERAAGQLGLAVEQTLVPPDHLASPLAEALPALVVAKSPAGANHFLLVWRSHGPLVQVMDPASGRRWVRRAELERGLYVHQTEVPAADFRAWAASDEFLGPLRERLLRLCTARAAEELIDEALRDPGATALAALDAAVRLAAELQAAAAVEKGDEAALLVRSLACRAVAGDRGQIPERCFTALPAGCDDEGTPLVALRGAVVVRVSGRASPDAAAEPLPAALAEAVRVPAQPPLLQLLALLRAEGLFDPAVLLSALLLAALGGVVQALALRGALDLGQLLGAPRQRVVAGLALLLFVAGLLGLELHLFAGLQRLGRSLEVRLRLALQRKVPRLADRFLASRPLSDMAERCHSVQQLRQAPLLGAQLLRCGTELLVTVAGLIWLDPAAAPVALLVALVSLGLPALALRLTSELDLRARSHAGGLARFTIDALQGLVAVRAHGGERALRREQETLLAAWLRAGRELLSVSLLLEGLVGLTGSAGAVLLFALHLRHGPGSAAALLFLFWALNLPALGQQAAALVRQVPALRSGLLRLLEPLSAPEEAEAAPPAAAPPAAVPSLGRRGAHLDLRTVDVRAGGHPVLQGVDLEIPGGSEVAVVGPSGAGKSSLLGLLLGWHRASVGEVLVDGAPLDLQRLRRETAWVDPAVQLWNQTLFDNLRYGQEGTPPLQAALDAAELGELLERLPDGLQSPLGEGGGLVSGGEGQRVRLGRAMLRREARLVLLDEPFRGLDRERRSRLLLRARAFWRGATLLCVTHDVGETLDFPRVLVVEGGRVVEDGDPRLLAARPGSRYAALLAAERELRELLWAGHSFRRLRLEDGALVEPERAA